MVSIDYFLIFTIFLKTGQSSVSLMAPPPSGKKCCSLLDHDFHPSSKCTIFTFLDFIVNIYVNTSNNINTRLLLILLRFQMTGAATPCYWSDSQPTLNPDFWFSSIMRSQQCRDWCRRHMWSGNSGSSLLIRSLVISLIHSRHGSIISVLNKDQFSPIGVGMNRHDICQNFTLADFAPLISY